MRGYVKEVSRPTGPIAIDFVPVTAESGDRVIWVGARIILRDVGVLLKPSDNYLAMITQINEAIDQVTDEAKQFAAERLEEYLA